MRTVVASELSRPLLTSAQAALWFVGKGRGFRLVDDTGSLTHCLFLARIRKEGINYRFRGVLSFLPFFPDALGFTYLGRS